MLVGIFLALWMKVGSKQAIEYDQIIAVVIIGLLDHLRMVPTMKVDDIKDVVEWSQFDVDIAMLREATDYSYSKIHRKHNAVGTE